MICRNCREDHPCSTCKKCLECSCRCFTCKRCSRRFPEPYRYCSKCFVCRGCCHCRKAPAYLPHESLRILEGSGYLSRLPRTLGVEVEIGEWKRMSLTQSIPHLRFSATHDWSVKPSETEMVLAPMRKDAFLRGMLSLSKELIRCGCVLNHTCAMHVHVGGEDLSYWEIRRLLEVYTHLESDIYSHLIAPHRHTLPEAVHYCQMMTQPHTGPCQRCSRYDTQYPNQRVAPEPITIVLARMWRARSTSDLKLCLIRMLYGIENPSSSPDTLHSRKGGKYEWSRYFGLNLHSWQHRLTVEWRMKEATSDPMEMVCWPLWCGWVVHAITRMSDAEARSPEMSVRYLTDRYMPPLLREWITLKGIPK